MGRPGPFSPRAEVSLLIATTPRLLHQRDVSNVQQVEATVREHHAFAVRLPRRDALHQLLARHHLVLGMQRGLRSQRGQQFVLLHRHGAHLAHHNAGGNIRQFHRRLRLQARGQAQCQHRDHRIAGAGHIEHLPRHRRRHKAIAGPHQRDALLA
jgi:hypothetical protein